MNPVHISILHREHSEWLNKLAFYADDLRIMENRLQDLVNRKTDAEILALVEHFQNQIIIHKVEIESLKENIWAHEKQIVQSVLDEPNGVAHREMRDHNSRREKIERFEEIFDILRKDLITFLSKVY